MHGSKASFELVTVVIPARNESTRISSVLDAVASQEKVDAAVEIIVVDDASSDDTASRATRAGVTLLEIAPGEGGGNPAHARNVGAEQSRGDPIVFLDADCIPSRGWLAAILKAHTAGASVVGGALDLPPGLGITARCDYYCGCYFVHSRRAAGEVPHHPPNNLSVRRDAFFATSGFSEQEPLSYTNEERLWLAEARDAGHPIVFEPAATVHHYNRPGFSNLLRRSYRWGYTALEAKSESGVTRGSWWFSRPWLVLVSAPILPFVLSAHVVASWARADRYEPILLLPLILLSRTAYVAGMVVGGIRWLRSRGAAASQGRPAPRWQ